MTGWGDADNPFANAGAVLIRKATEESLEKIEWLWRGWLASGKFHILAGSKGTGKSTLLYDLAARLTAGPSWPDGTPVATRRDAMIWSGEDGIRDTILPRFVIAGGDRNRLYFPTHTFVDGEKRPF